MVSVDFGCGHAVVIMSNNTILDVITTLPKDN